MKTLLINARVRLDKNIFTDSVGFDSESGKITFTGNSDRTNTVRKSFDEVIDIKQKLVLPAFTDGHCHFIKGSLVNSQLDLRDASTKKDFINGILEYRKEKKSNWIHGGYFSDTNFKERIELNAKTLDEICNDVPVVVSRFDMHSAFANTKALELSGINSIKSDFTKEEFLTDVNGPTGELKERAMYYVLGKIPVQSVKERTDIALKQMSRFHSYGIAAISDITMPEDLDIYLEILKQNKLKFRVDSRLPFYEFQNIERVKDNFKEYSELIRFKSFKAFYDGSLTSKTAFMHDKYKNTGHNGIKTEYVNSGEFHQTAIEIDKAGYQSSVHAIGDRAVTELLDLNEELILKNGKLDRRFRIEHAQHIHENDFQRFKQLNVIASVQPAHLFSDAKTSKEVLNDFSIEHNYKKLFDNGSHVCFGTDFPVVSESPFETIYYAMTRKVNGFENGFLNENRISLDECIDAYTSGNAYATFEEKIRGNIEEGKLADLIVLEDDLFEMRPEDVLNANVNMTYFNGERIY